MLKPFKSTKMQDTYKVKLQDPGQIDAFYRRAPPRGGETHGGVRRQGVGCRPL